MTGLLAAVVVAVAVAGCAGESASIGGGEVAPIVVGVNSSGSVVTDIPDFTGPWADRFKQLYADTDDLGRQVLADGVISEQEYFDVTAQIDECFAARGYQVERKADGSMTLEDMRERGENAPVGEDATECQGIAGGIDQLYADMQRNPDNTDMNELMAACLVKGGLVDSSFTKQDYVNAMEGATLPWSVDDPVFQECLADPLGLLDANHG